MRQYERELQELGYSIIAGVDEAGRGCLLGDVVAAAVVLSPDHTYVGLDDSKKLTAKKRERLYEEIMKHALDVGVGRVDAETIDAINIRQASRLAMKRAVEALQLLPDALCIDYEMIDMPIQQWSIVHGDALCASIAAASIVAKVTRDRLCHLWNEQFPEYGICDHKGYGTAFHREQLARLGPTPLHRKTFSFRR